MKKSKSCKTCKYWECNAGKVGKCMGWTLLGGFIYPILRPKEMKPSKISQKENINVGSQIISTNENWVCNNWRAK